MKRRRFLHTSLGVAGLSLPGLLGLRKLQAAEGTGVGRAKSCIVLFCWGGISQLDSWDPKPNAPKEIRGQFKPISTATPGIQLSEHMPKIARTQRSSPSYARCIVAAPLTAEPCTGI